MDGRCGGYDCSFDAWLVQWSAFIIDDQHHGNDRVHTW